MCANIGSTRASACDGWPERWGAGQAQSARSKGGNVFPAFIWRCGSQMRWGRLSATYGERSSCGKARLYNRVHHRIASVLAGRETDDSALVCRKYVMEKEGAAQPLPSFFVASATCATNVSTTGHISSGRSAIVRRTRFCAQSPRLRAFATNAEIIPSSSCGVSSIK